MLERMKADVLTHSKILLIAGYKFVKQTRAFDVTFELENEEKCGKTMFRFSLRNRLCLFALWHFISATEWRFRRVATNYGCAIDRFYIFDGEYQEIFY